MINKKLHIIELISVVLILASLSGFIYTSPVLSGKAISVSEETEINDKNSDSVIKNYGDESLEDTQVEKESKNEVIGETINNDENAPTSYTQTLSNEEINNNPVKIASVSVEAGTTIAIGNLG